jgi:hypothetical protein
MAAWLQQLFSKTVSSAGIYFWACQNMLPSSNKNKPIPECPALSATAKSNVHGRLFPVIAYPGTKSGHRVRPVMLVKRSWTKPSPVFPGPFVRRLPNGKNVLP